MKKLALLFHISLMLSYGLSADSQRSLHTFLFCLKPELQPLQMSLNRGKVSTGMDELDNYFQDCSSSPHPDQPGFDILAWENAFSVVFDAPRPIFSGISTPLRGATAARRPSQ